MLEPILKGLIEWIYELMIDIMEYASGELIGVMSMDLSYFERTAPVISDIVNVFIALGWALLIGNLVFQSVKIMVSGAGFEAEDPKTLFLRTFVFAFLLLASREICELCSAMAGTVINMLDLPASINVTTPDESMFSLGSGAKWLLVIIVGVVLMVQMVKLLFEIGERYVITSVLTFFAPLAFAMGGSKNTNDIFKGWCRMYGSMLIMMIMNIVFLKLIMSAMSQMASGGVLVWLVFVVALTRVARKIDSHIGKIGLNPAQTGNELGSRIPGVMTMMAVKVMSSAIGKSMANAKGTSGKNGSSGAGHSGGHRNNSRYRNNSNRSSSYYGSNTNGGYNNGGNNANYTSNGQSVHNGYSGGNTNVSNSGAASYGRNSNINNGSINSNTGQNIGTDNAQRLIGGKNSPRQQIGMNVPRQNGSVIAPTQNGDVNVKATSNAQRPTVMHRSNGMQSSVSHNTANRNENTNSTNTNGISSTSYALNKGRYKGVSGQNLHSIQGAMQNNHTRPVIPRDTSGRNPSGESVMGNVVRNSMHGTTSNNGNVNSNLHNTDGRNTHNSGMSQKPGGTTIPNMRQGAVNTNIGGGVQQNNGRMMNINNGGHSDMHTSGSSNVSGGARNSDIKVGGKRNSVQNAGNQGNIRNTVGGNTNLQTNGGVNIGGSNAHTQNGGMNVMQNNSGIVHHQSDKDENHSFTEHFDGVRFEQHEREVQNDRFTNMCGSNEFTRQQQINHEYRQGKYNPASVNKKVSKSYYRKESLRERFNERPNKKDTGRRKK